MPRKPNGASTIYLGADGYWHGRVVVGTRDDGRPDRRHVRGKSEAVVTKKVRELERDRDRGAVRRVGERWTVESWLTHWVENIAAPHVRENTADGYRVAVRKHLIPGVGAHRLEKLLPEHLEKLYARMQKKGSSPGTAHQAHRTIRTALNEATRRGYLTQNPARLAKSPRLSDAEIEPFSVEEVQKLFAGIEGRRNRARWVIALALGLRQGEALGLQWADVDLKEGNVRVRRGRMRPKYAHGCGGTCGRKPGYCRQRQQTRDDTADTKSSAGRRTIGLPPELVALLREHQAEQERERTAARQLWEEGGWVFATQTGRPLNPNTDYHEWKQILRDTGLPNARLHDARHTAATVLLILGVTERAAMAVMGWATTAMAKRYQHLVDPVRQDVAKRVGGLLWATPAKPKGKGRKGKKKRRPDPGDDGPAGVPARL